VVADVYLSTQNGHGRYMKKLQLSDVLNDAIKDALTNVHTTTLAIVTAVNTKTINVRPVINRQVDGVSRDLPEFIEVPPIFLQGGGSYTSYPIAIGDYCLLLISERCFDRWYVGQDFVSPAEYRMHDYSDGIAIVGINPESSAITIPSEVQRNGNYTQTGNVTHLGDYDITGDYEQAGDMTIVGDFKLTGNMQVIGNITCTGTISAANFTGTAGGAMSSSVDIETTGEVTAGGIDLSTHTHDYTWTDPGGSGTTNTPN